MGLQFGDVFNESGEGDVGLFLIFVNNFQNVVDVEMMNVDFVVEVVFVIIEVGYFSFGSFVGSEGGKSSEKLMRDRSVDFYVVVNNGIEGGGGWEGDFGGGFQGFDRDNIFVFFSEI